jgi:hypothetical protein
MRSRFRAAAALAFVALLATACQPGFTAFPRLNQRPTVKLTAAPVGVADTTWYSYEIHWSGEDADGRVERFEYVIDPPAGPDGDTLWIATTKHHETFRFRATEAYWDPVHGWRANGVHVFAIRAVDDRGATSAVASRAFFSYTIAPTVRVTLPEPSVFVSRQVPQGGRIEWEGEDEDGIASKRPVRYKYRVFRPDDAGFDFSLAQTEPDSLRRFYAARAFAGWDSVGGDTTFAHLPLLQPGMPHLFVVVAFDEAGAYSPEFSLATNMLKFIPAEAWAMGPVFTVWTDYGWNEFMQGGINTDPLAWFRLDVPAGVPVTLRWSATPLQGTYVVSYAWRLDNGPAHGPSDSTSCTLGPFTGGEEHTLTLSAVDSWGLASLVIVNFRVVAITFEKELLVVDDTRLAPDRFNAGNPVPITYGNTPWPAAAELDTFLFAHGGFPWRGPHGVTGDLPLSKPGLFAGYSYDTLGTRRGFTDPSMAVPLSLLGRYRHVLWLTDVIGVTTTYGPDSPVDPISTLRWMSAPGRMNTLLAYVQAGGEVWLAGGTALTSAVLPYNATGSRDNDGLYGPGHVVFNAVNAEIPQAGLAWAGARWRSEFVAGRAATLPRKSSAAVGGWSNPGWRFGGTITAPDYARLPASLRRRALALGDSLPPTRASNPTSFYSTAVNPAVEYLTQPNRILEDVDADPLVVDSRAVLDTLYELQGGTLATGQTGQRPASMTYSHGVEGPKFVMTGFDLWTWSRQDVQALVDFVLQEIWGMNRSMTRPPQAPAAPPRLARRGALPVAPGR